MSAFAFNPDGSVVASGDTAGNVVLWDVSSGERITVLPDDTPSHEREAVNVLMFSPDERILAVGGAEDKVHLWDAGTGERLGEPLGVENVGGFGYQSTGALAFSADSRNLALGGRRVRIVDTDTFQPISETNSTACTERTIGMAFRNDDSELVTVCGGQASVWDVASGAKLSEVELVRGVGSNALAVSPDGAVAAIELGFNVGLFDIDSGARLATLPTDGRTKASEIAFSADGSVLAYGGSAEGGAGKMMWLWDLVADEQIGNTLSSGGGAGDGIASLAVSPDASHAVVGYMGTDMRARLWALGR